MKLRNLQHLPNLFSDHLRTLPLMVLYLTDGCNSKCAMCDIWQAPRRNMSLDLVDNLVESAQKLRTEMVLLSGGEAMQHPEWPTIAAKFRANGIKVWLLTNALLLKKQATQIIENIDAVTVSLDAATPELYQQIRGVDGLDLILEGMQIVSAAGIPVTTRTTLMQINYQQMPQIVDVALGAGAKSVSFLAVDTVNPYAFGPRFSEKETIPLSVKNPFGGLTADDLPQFHTLLNQMERDYATQFAEGRIEESPAKLRRLYDYFAEPHGLTQFEAPRCNAPHTSLVVNVDGSLQPCYFLPSWGNLDNQQLSTALNAEKAIELRAAYRQGQREECQRCVCPLYRGPRSLLGGL